MAGGNQAAVGLSIWAVGLLWLQTGWQLLPPTLVALAAGAILVLPGTQAATRDKADLVCSNWPARPGYWQRGRPIAGGGGRRRPGPCRRPRAAAVARQLTMMTGWWKQGWWQASHRLMTWSRASGSTRASRRCTVASMVACGAGQRVAAHLQQGLRP
jgi:hypothetical protein